MSWAGRISQQADQLADNCNTLLIALLCCTTDYLLIGGGSRKERIPMNTDAIPCESDG